MGLTVVDLKTRPSEIHESVIDRLEEVLADARAGAVTQVAIAVVKTDGAIANCWSETDDFGRLVGAVSRLQYRLNVKADEE